MKNKIISYIVFSMITLIIVISALLTSIFNHQYEARVKDELIVNTHLLERFVTSYEGKLDKIDEYLHLEEFPLRVTFISYDGEVLYDSYAEKNNLDNHVDREEIQLAKENGEGFSVRFSDSIEKNMMYYAISYKDEMFIRTSLPMNYISIFKDKNAKYYLAVILIVTLLSVWFARKIAYVIVKPISDLDFITSRIARGEFSRRVIIRSNDEIGKLGTNFNKMTDKLENTIKEVVDKQNRLQAILGSMDSGVIAIDRNFKIIMMNRYAKEIFSINTDVIGKGFLECIRNYELEKIITSNSNEYNELRLYYPVERVLRIKTADIINGNDHIGTVAVFSDITDIKRLENMRTQFVANVSHELKTPLTSIKGFAETLREVDDEKTKNKFLDIINDESERLTRLINDILTLSHIEHQKEVVVEDIDVKAIINDVYYMLKDRANDKNITFGLQLSEVENLRGDCDKFKQMMLNLVENAIKYSEEGDSIKVSTVKEDKNCIITVEDTGVGIPKEHIPRLFERFYRVDKARSRAKGGTGLGLAIVKHIVIGFKGDIEVESEVGVGSKFIISLPYEG